jgi:hypothetical protein
MALLAYLLLYSALHNGAHHSLHVCHCPKVAFCSPRILLVHVLVMVKVRTFRTQWMTVFPFIIPSTTRVTFFPLTTQDPLANVMRIRQLCNRHHPLHLFLLP